MGHWAGLRSSSSPARGKKCSETNSGLIAVTTLAAYTPILRGRCHGGTKNYDNPQNRSLSWSAVDRSGGMRTNVQSANSGHFPNSNRAANSGNPNRGTSDYGAAKHCADNAGQRTGTRQLDAKPESG